MKNYSLLDLDNCTNIPAELKALPQWVVWSLETRDGKPTKVPYTPQTNTRASSTGAETWDTFDEAVSAFIASRKTDKPYHGIGFVFNNDYTGIDIDDCIDKNGELNAIARHWVDALNSYTEVTPSTQGIHIILKGSLDGPGRRKDKIEIYSLARYFTLTGRVLHPGQTPTVCREAPLTLATLMHESGMILASNSSSSSESPSNPLNSIDPYSHIQITVDPATASDNRTRGFLKAMLDNNATFKATWDRKRKDWNNAADKSASAYCHSICIMALQALAESDLSPQESYQLVANLILLWREQHDESLHLNNIRHKYKGAIASAENKIKSDAAMQTLSHLPETFAGIGVKPVVLSIQSAEQLDDDHKEDRREILDNVSELLGVPVYGIYQFGDTDCLWQAIFGHKESDQYITAQFNSTHQFRNQAVWLERIMEIFGKAIPTRKNQSWNTILQAMLAATIKIKASTTFIEEVNTFIYDRYLPMAIVQDENHSDDTHDAYDRVTDAMYRGMPINVKGILMFSVKSLYSAMIDSRSGFVLERDAALRQALITLGAENKIYQRITYREAGVYGVTKILARSLIHLPVEIITRCYENSNGN